MGHLPNTHHLQSADDSNDYQGTPKSSGLTRSTLGLLLIGAVLSCLVSQGSAKNGEVATNSFYVKIHADKKHPDPGGLAHKIARRNGFHNLGPVSEKIQL